MVHGFKGRNSTTQANEDEAARQRSEVAASVPNLTTQTAAIPSHLADLVAWGEEQDRQLKGKR